MPNLAMRHKIETRQALDLKDFPQTEEGCYVLTGSFTPAEIDAGALDFCDSSTEEWIWSIGVDGEGNILAAKDARFYEHEEYECLWLR